VKRKRSSLTAASLFMACNLPLPNRMRVLLYKVAGVEFVNWKKVFIGHKAYIDIWSKETHVKIGEHCIIASGVRVLTHYLDGKSTPHTFYEGSVIIEDRVFIGLNAVIAKPVIIGSGAVIAPNSLVTRDVSPYSIVMGVPAKAVGTRQKKNI
jgi:acetyltransferase-like isoleucine patch superfamily enzyme